jgi:hypothetical protein
LPDIVLGPGDTVVDKNKFDRMGEMFENIYIIRIYQSAHIKNSYTLTTKDYPIFKKWAKYMNRNFSKKI